MKLYHDKILDKGNIIKLQKGLELIKRGGYAFHTDVSSTYIILKGYFLFVLFKQITHDNVQLLTFTDFLNDDEICELQNIAYAPPFPTGPAVPLMSPYKELIKIK